MSCRGNAALPFGTGPIHSRRYGRRRNRVVASPSAPGYTRSSVIFCGCVVFSMSSPSGRIAPARTKRGSWSMVRGCHGCSGRRRSAGSSRNHTNPRPPAGKPGARSYPARSDRRDEKRRPEHVFVIQAEDVGVRREIHEECAHEGRARLLRPAGLRVEVGQELIPELQVLHQDRLGHLAIGPHLVVLAGTVQTERWGRRRCIETSARRVPGNRHPVPPCRGRHRDRGGHAPGGFRAAVPASRPCRKTNTAARWRRRSGRSGSARATPARKGRTSEDQNVVPLRWAPM